MSGGLEPSGPLSWGENSPIWMQDSTFTDAYISDPKYLTLSGANSLATNGWAPMKGSSNLGSSSMLVDVGFANKGLSYVHPGASGFLTADPFATAVTGLNRPFGLWIYGQIPAPPVAASYMFAFARSSGTNPLYQCGFAGGAVEDFGGIHRDDSGNTKTTGAVTPGTVPFVYTYIWDGSHLNTWLDYAPQDVNLPFDTAANTTLDRVTFFALRTLGIPTAFSDWRIRGILYRPASAPSDLIRIATTTHLVREHQ